MIGVIAMFGSAMAFFAHRAETNDRGLIINGIIELGPHGADIFYAVFAGLSGALAALGVLGLIRAFGAPMYVVLEHDAIVVPGPMFSPRARRVEFERIRALETWNVNGQVGLTIRYDGGRAGIARSMVGEAAFQEIIGELKARRPKL
jgi:hypothetical protein